MKLHKIAYSHDAVLDEYVVFKQARGRDYSLATFTKHKEAEMWIKQNYITLGKLEDYDLCLPFTICEDKPTNQHK